MNPRPHTPRQAPRSLGKLTLLAALLTLGVFSTKTVQAQVRAKLQWFDSHGEIIDLDWATSVQWIWTSEKKPVAQVIINVPEQLNLSSTDEEQAKFMNGVPDRDGKISNRTLVVDMDGPRKTIKLKKSDPTSDASEIGLTVLLNTHSANIVPSESCTKEGIAIEPRQAEANFIFLAASCKKTPAGLRVSLETSNDALLAKDEDDQLEVHSSADPLLILIPKKTLEVLKPDMVVATVKAESQTTPAMTTQFELIYTKDTVTKAEVVHTIKPTQFASPNPSADNKTWQFTEELGLGFLGYQAKISSRRLDPSEFNLNAKLYAEHALGVTTRFKSDLDIPVITMMPNVHFPASGFYKGTGRASFTVFDRGKIAFYLEPGVEVGGTYFRNRSDMGGLYEGPVLAAYLTGTVGKLNNRTMSAYFSASPLAGRGLDPLFNSWDFSSTLAVEVLKGDAERRWDLILRFNYLNFHTPTSADAKSTEMIFGIRTGL